MDSRPRLSACGWDGRLISLRVGRTPHWLAGGTLVLCVGRAALQALLALASCRCISSKQMGTVGDGVASAAMSRLWICGLVKSRRCVSVELGPRCSHGSGATLRACRRRSAQRAGSVRQATFRSACRADDCERETGLRRTPEHARARVMVGRSELRRCVNDERCEPGRGPIRVGNHTQQPQAGQTVESALSIVCAPALTRATLLHCSGPCRRAEAVGDISGSWRQLCTHLVRPPRQPPLVSFKRVRAAIVRTRPQQPRTACTTGASSGDSRDRR